MPKYFTFCATPLVALSLLAAPAFAGNHGGKGGPGKNHAPQAKDRVAPAGQHNVRGHCPPGLAKKAVPCVPPGQVKQLYRTGDVIRDGYVTIGHPGKWAPDSRGNYVQAGGYIYQVSPDTHKVLTVIGAVADLLE